VRLLSGLSVCDGFAMGLQQDHGLPQKQPKGQNQHNQKIVMDTADAAFPVQKRR
jgi:hypothetical protein